MRQEIKAKYKISIHALREEGDAIPPIIDDDLWISIHALREEGDRSIRAEDGSSVQFLSTPSARRATSTPLPYFSARVISIHALREEGDLPFQKTLPKMEHFYPRPPRGGRRRRRKVTHRQRLFLSTPSARRATGSPPSFPASSRNFYPRPPRGGRPSGWGRCVPSVKDFYPRPPRRGRRKSGRTGNSQKNFYPRPPRRGRRHWQHTATKK